MNDLTWTCHVCGEERPDAFISVAKHQHQIKDAGGATMHCHVRYCNDRADCASNASTKCLVMHT